MEEQLTLWFLEQSERNRGEIDFWLIWSVQVPVGATNNIYKAWLKLRVRIGLVWISFDLWLWLISSLGERSLLLLVVNWKRDSILFLWIAGRLEQNLSLLTTTTTIVSERNEFKLFTADQLRYVCAQQSMRLAINRWLCPLAKKKNTHTRRKILWFTSDSTIIDISIGHLAIFVFIPAFKLFTRIHKR